jgi:hypothetical protein
MIKALSATAIVSCLAAAVTVLPAFAPRVEASVPHAVAKGDRLDIRPVGRACSEQAWPNFEAACLRRAGARTGARTAAMTEARLVSTDRP